MHTAKTGKQIKPALFIFFTGLILALLSACQSPPQLFQQRFLQFGTVIDITLITQNQQQALQLFDDIETLLIKRHHQWHGWQDGTLKQFNQALLQTENGIKIPQTLQLLINDSKEYYSISGGLFNPAMGQLIEAWGFHQQSTTPKLSLINKIKQDIPGMHDLIIKDNHAISRNPYLQLDFGAIAKGLAVRQISQLIQQNHIQNFIINAGGDIYAEGSKQQKNWRVAIENPFQSDTGSDNIIGSISLAESTSIFTSGNYRRFYIDENNNRRHHIINPITGEPSLNISAITVMHKDPVIADIAATTLMITDISELNNMARKLGIKDFLAITDQHQIHISPSMMNKIQWTDKQLFSTQLLPAL